MSRRTTFLLVSTILLLVVWQTYEHLRPAPISYNQDIRPIVNRKCIACHGGVKKSGGFSLLFRHEALDTTESGVPAIVPGDAAASELMQRITHHDPELRMPLEAEPLSEAEVKLFRRWIDQGAKWEKHWAYIAPDITINPPDAETNWGHNEVDPFVYARLLEQQLTPAPPAAPADLLRRLSLDLTGLPPTPAEVEAFVNDAAPEAYERAVDRLLASPRFGEHWAAMWLDLARYADTKGYEKDLERSIWQYRDWVIRAFNNDMPFDQFTIEQLAGDLLPQPTEAQYIATAFHRNTMANDEGGTDDEEFRVAAVFDRVSTTWEVWQGTTMACVQCHSHPYDPIVHEEFYQAYAFFNNTEDRDIYNEQPKLFTYAPKDEEKLTEIIRWINQRLKPDDQLPDRNAFLHEQKEDLLYHLGYRRVEAEEFANSSRFIELTMPDQKSVWQIQDSSWIMFEDVDLTEVKAVSYHWATPYSGIIELRLDSVTGPIISRTKVIKTGDFDHRLTWDQWQVKKVPITPTRGQHDLYYTFRKDQHYSSDLFRLDWIFYHERQPRQEKYNADFRANVAALASLEPIQTPILRELPKEKQRTTYHFTRGNWLTPGEPVSPGIPASMGELTDPETPTRLDLARWLMSDKNPLTARVIVNRFWDRIFGYGLVETPEDFGTQGFAPSHPQLLDWLAVQFRDEHRWSVKQLLKQIVLSATYRQASTVTPEKLERDPRNQWLSRGARVRLSAEQIRDQALAVSGLLNDEMYGPSVRPPQPASLGKWAVSEGEDRYRRAVYTFWHRTNPYPSMISFDSPGRNLCVSRRIRTNTPLQALTLLNDTVYVEAAYALARRLHRTTYPSVEAQLADAYRRVMLREPDDNKLRSIQSLYTDALAQYQATAAPDGTSRTVAYQAPDEAELKTLTLVANALLNMDEFITKN
jgi:hypothetical protein